METVVNESMVSNQLNSIFHDLDNGHHSFEKDKQKAKVSHVNLAFGEVCVESITDLMEENRLDVANAKVVFDLGSGRGKLLLQLLLQYPHLKKLVGIEFTQKRANLSFEALEKMKLMLEKEKGICSIIYKNVSELRSMNIDFEQDMLFYENHSTLVVFPPNRMLRSELEGGIGPRTVSLYHGDLFETKAKIHEADIVILETIISTKRSKEIIELLCCTKKGCRLLTYQDLNVHFQDGNNIEWREILPRKRYSCSWSQYVVLYVWIKV